MADLRNAQLEALDLPNVGYATAVDLGDAASPFGSVHPRFGASFLSLIIRDKQTVGQRLANYALAQIYGKQTTHLFPLYQSATGR